MGNSECGNEVLRDAYGGGTKILTDLQCGTDLPMTGNELLYVLIAAVLLIAVGLLLRKHA